MLFLVAQMVKNLPAVWETQVQSLGWEDPLEKEVAIHFSILAWKFPWTEEPSQPQSMWSHRVGHDWTTHTFFTFTLSCLSIIGSSNNGYDSLSAIFIEDLYCINSCHYIVFLVLMKDIQFLKCLLTYYSFIAKLIKILEIIKHFLVAQMVKNLPAMQET